MRAILGRRITGAFTAVLLVVALTAAVRAAEPVAVIVQVTGRVTVQRAAGGSAPVTVGMRLEPGDKLVPSGGGTAVLLFKTGKKETVKEQREIMPVTEAEQTNLFNRSVGTLTRVASTDAAQNPNRQGMIRPIAGSAVPIAPRNEIAVRSERPTFSWFSIPGSTGYMVQLRRIDGPCAPGVADRPQSCRPVRFRAGRDTAWTMPAAEPGLERGATYAWTVASQGGGRPAPEQKFRIASQEEETKLAAALADLRAAGLDPETDGLLVSALLYREAGLYYDARAALDRIDVQAAGPEIHQLRGEVFDALGDLDAASRAFAAAKRQ